MGPSRPLLLVKFLSERQKPFPKPHLWPRPSSEAPGVTPPGARQAASLMSCWRLTRACGAGPPVWAAPPTRGPGPGHAPSRTTQNRRTTWGSRLRARSQAADPGTISVSAPLPTPVSGSALRPASEMPRLSFPPLPTAESATPAAPGHRHGTGAPPIFLCTPVTS